MAYQPYDRTPKGIVFFGENAADQVYESTSGFVYTSGTSTLDVPNVNISTDLDVGGNVDVTGNGTFDGDLTVYGDLNVSGVVNQVNLEELLVEDSSITLRSNATGTPSDGDDASIVVNRGASSDVDIRWDEGNDYWSFTNTASNVGPYHPLLISGSGLTTNGSNVDLDLCGLATVTSATDSDEIAICQGGNSVKITRSNLLSGLGDMSSWTVADESNTQKTIQNNDVVRHSGVGLDVTVTGSSSPYLLTFSVNVDDSTLEVHTDDNLRIKDSGISFNHLSDALVIASGEAFSDSDNALMTAAAIADKIESYNYGTITEVVGGSGLKPDSGLTTGSVTLNVNTDNNTIGVNGSDEVYVRDLGIDTAQLAAGAVTEAKRERTVGTYNSTSSITHDIALGSGVIDLTLPPAASGQMVFVKRTDSTTGALTVSASGSQTIDGAGNKALYYQYESINVVSDGNNWFIV
jgi:hypothetical protein